MISQPVHNEIHKNKPYKDPLKNPLLVAASYSNEIGTAIIEIAPKVGTALWAPALMYLGADIFDKYKNDKNKFDPSAKRAFERTVYQGVSGYLFMPLLIFCAQNLVSPLARLTKDGISTNAKDAVFKHTREILSQIEGENFDNPDKFKQVLETTLRARIKNYKHEKNETNFFKRLFKLNLVKSALTVNNEDKIINFALKNADKMYELKQNLVNNNFQDVPRMIKKDYLKSVTGLKIFGETNFTPALKSSLQKLQNMNIFKNKILKTLGGFVPIIFLSKPVNHFVEKVIVNKYIDLGIDEITKGFVHNTRFKRTFNEMDKNNTEKAQKEKPKQAQSSA